MWLLASLFDLILRQAAAWEPLAEPRGPWAVGHRALAGPDGPLAVWYPVAPSTPMAMRLYGRIFLGRTAVASTPVAPGRWPLAILSHGLRGSRFDLAWLAGSLAARGWVVVAGEHPGTARDGYEPARATRLAARAAQLTAILDHLEAAGDWRLRLNFDRVLAIGHSAGGSTALAWAGAQVDADLLQAYDPGQLSPPVAVVEPRLAAVVALAPGTGPVFAASGLSGVQLPVLLISGTADRHTPEELCAGHYAAHLPNASWERLAGAGHYIFKPVCNLYGRLRVPNLCRDAAGVDRAAAHAQIEAWLHAFLAAHALGPSTDLARGAHRG